MSESDKSDVWTVRGVSPDTKTLVKNAAAVSNEPIGRFVSEALRAAAFKALNMPAIADDRVGTRSGASLVEIASKLRNMEFRLQKLEKAGGRPGSEHADDWSDDEGKGGELIHKLIQGTDGKRNQLHERLISTLMESMRAINDPLLTRQMQTVIVAARGNMQANASVFSLGARHVPDSDSSNDLGG